MWYKTDISDYDELGSPFTKMAPDFTQVKLWNPVKNTPKSDEHKWLSIKYLTKTGVTRYKRGIYVDDGAYKGFYNGQLDPKLIENVTFWSFETYFKD